MIVRRSVLDRDRGRNELVLQSFRMPAYTDISDHQEFFGAYQRTEHDLDGKHASILSPPGEFDSGTGFQRQCVHG